MEALSLVSAIMVAFESFYMQMIFMSNNLEDLKIQLQAWGTSLDIQSLRVSIRKTKILGSSGKAQRQQVMLNGPVVYVPKELV